jgi:rhodanese-related sulfurtransferase
MRRGPFHRLPQWAGRFRVRDRRTTESQAGFGGGAESDDGPRCPIELVDVRTEEERSIAKIEGSRLLNEEGHAYLLTLDRNTTIVFHCHHGIRSQAAAEYFLRGAGFRNLYNVRGGIDAWSEIVDPSVPRY